MCEGNKLGICTQGVYTPVYLSEIRNSLSNLTLFDVSIIKLTLTVRNDIVFAGLSQNREKTEKRGPSLRYSASRVLHKSDLYVLLT
jgi:hypothetical protein